MDNELGRWTILLELQQVKTHVELELVLSFLAIVRVSSWHSTMVLMQLRLVR